MMKFLLKELINPNTTILNDTQKAVLVMVHIAPTPEVAYENTSFSENLATARDLLLRLGALSNKDKALELTERGTDMLKYHNLVDDMGELTEDAEELLNASEEISQVYNLQDVKEGFRILPTLINP